MRGRPNDPAKAKAKARAHAKRGHFCDCGKVVFGNGGNASHADMHKRRGDGHHCITSEAWTKLFGTREPHQVFGHPMFCVCLECMTVTAASHKAADAACGRTWVCSCGACNQARALVDIEERLNRLASMERRHAAIRAMKDL